MKRLFTLILAAVASYAAAQPAKDRVVPNDPSKYRELSAVHAGAGKMGFTQLIGRTELSTNFLYLHAGVIDAKSGIGHHFHHNIEEMYVILNGEAEFTINGRTSKIKAPAIVPCKMGNSHAIYNASGERIRWLNFAVSANKGRSDAFDLGDTRAGTTIDRIPVFVSSRLEREKVKGNNPAYTGNGVLYRRIIGPEVFNTDWNHVDHVVIPAGSSTPRQLEGVEEVYYVVKGKGAVAFKEDKATFKADDAFYGKLGEMMTITNDGTEDVELLVIGVSPSKQKNLSVTKPLANPKAMVLQMDFIVAKENAAAFEKMYYSIYVPAMTVQQGYVGSKLLRLYPENVSKEIEAEPTTYNYQIQISFDTEENRRKWVASSQHQIAWPAATALAKEYKWRGYDVMGDDDQP
jgi:mannose-6-phosphate isomerase-like protein (cupin superfamily)/heme-degrading monooxygenase HmoA